MTLLETTVVVDFVVVAVVDIVVVVVVVIVNLVGPACCYWSHHIWLWPINVKMRLLEAIDFVVAVVDQ